MIVHLQYITLLNTTVFFFKLFILEFLVHGQKKNQPQLSIHIYLGPYNFT